MMQPLSVCGPKRQDRENMKEYLISNWELGFEMTTEMILLDFLQPCARLLELFFFFSA